MENKNREELMKETQKELSSFWAMFFPFAKEKLNSVKENFTEEKFEKFMEDYITSEEMVAPEDNNFDYEMYIDFIKNIWEKYPEGQKPKATVVIEKKYKINLKDPRWLAFHPKDIKYWSEKKFTKRESERLEKFVMWVNAQFYYHENKKVLCDKIFPEPSVPQAFQGNIYESIVKIFAFNPGEDDRLETGNTIKEISLKEQKIATRNTIFKNMMEIDISRLTFPSIIQESIPNNKGGKWYSNNFLGVSGNKNHYLNQPGLSHVKNLFEKQGFSQIEKLPYQTPSKRKGVPNDFEELPSCKMITSVVNSILSNESLNKSNFPRYYFFRKTGNWEDIQNTHIDILKGNVLENIHKSNSTLCFSKAIMKLSQEVDGKENSIISELKKLESKLKEQDNF